MTFQDLIPFPEILKALEELGYTEPTPIQAQAIPEIAKGSDIRGSAQTGTGKTAAFILPVLMRLMTPSTLPGRGPRALILVPTRELAVQVAAEARKFCKYVLRAKTVCIYGGTPYPPQYKELARPFEILVATPGRLIDLLEQKRVDFSRVEVFILDEADRMLDMGFIEPVELIAAALPPTRQTLLFSATLKGSVMNLSRRLLKNPVEISVAGQEEKHENIDQVLVNVDDISHKYRLLESLLEDPAVHQAIVFTSTKHQADQLAEKLGKSGEAVGVLHGGMRQRQRTSMIMKLRQNDVRVLVATDVAARGIDVPAISHVFNFDLPMSVEDYVHRIGRTGRAGATGTAFSFAKYNEQSLVRRIEQFTGQKIRLHVVPGMEARARSSGGYSPSRDSESERRGGGGGRFRSRGPSRDQRSGSGRERSGSFSGSFQDQRSGPSRERPSSFQGQRSGPSRERSGSFQDQRSGPSRERPGSFQGQRSGSGYGPGRERAGSFQDQRSGPSRERSGPYQDQRSGPSREPRKDSRFGFAKKRRFTP